MCQKKNEIEFFTFASILTITSAVLYWSWPLGFLLNPIASRKGLASELGAFGQPWNWVFIWGDIVSGLLLLIASLVLIQMYSFKGWARLTLILLAIYGICGGLDASLPERCLPSEAVCGAILHDPLLIVHGVFDIVGDTTLFFTLVTAALYVHRHNRGWRSWIYSIGAGGIIFALLSGIFIVWGGPGFWAQRYYITLSCVWVASIPFILRPKHSNVKRVEKLKGTMLSDLFVRVGN